ncbi:GSCOCG00011073001-RA-CDS, partial [Cotesia congregata]
MSIITDYCVLFNNALKLMYFPSKWKKADVIAIKKPGKNSNDPASYRPISLLPNIGKVYEIIISKAIMHFCNEEKIIPDHQFGFQKKLSTIHAITKFTSDICKALNNNECVGACLIDYEKAFDTRKCLRSCLKMYRSEITNYQHCINNQTLYNKANIPRIDSHILQLIRNH